MTSEYKAANAEFQAEHDAYTLVLAAYRALAIGDDEYLVARAKYYAALAKVDAAMALEESLPEAAEAPVESTQIGLFAV